MTETIQANVENIKYAKNDGWAVVKMRDVDHKPITVTGMLAGLRYGESLELVGRWESHDSFGNQFRAESFKPVQPSTSAGFERYLTGISGVGSVLARRLVERYGEAVLTVLGSDPQAARDLEGIGEQRSREIYDAVRLRSGEDEVMIQLHDVGLGSALALRVLRDHQDNALEWLREDPYRLREYHGVGFVTADKIAGALGVRTDHPGRIAAGIEHTLEEASRNGHVYLPGSELLGDAEKLLTVNEELITDTVESLAGEGKLVVDGFRIYLANLHRAEQGIVRHLCRLQSKPVAPVAYAVDAESKLELSEEQRDAVEQLLGAKVGILTGGPGTGKTTITAALVHSFAEAGKRIALASPTGKAAIRLAAATGRDAKTIHRLLEFSAAMGGFSRNPYYPLEVEVVVIDEASMVDVSLAYHLLAAVPDHARVVFVGDADQLPSVGPGRVLNDLMDSGAVPVARLTKIFRQATESLIVTNAHRINSGEVPIGGDDPKADDMFVSLAMAEAAQDLIVEIVCARIPAVYGFDASSDVQVLTPMRKGTLGTEALNERLRERLNPNGRPVTKQLRLGDRVMQTVNNYTLDVFNGETGIVVDHYRACKEGHHVPKGRSKCTACGSKAKDQIVVELAGVRKIYTPSDARQLVLAYAMTIHKSQGSEYPCVVMALHGQHFMMHRRTLFYTGVTRAKRLAVLVTDNDSMSRAVRIVGGNERHTHLQQLLLQGN